MPFLANKTMNLGGTEFAKGQEVPDKVFNAMTPNRQGAMLRTRLILEVEAVPTTKKKGELCPVCGGGPYSRLAQHLSLKHPDIEQE